MNITLLNYTYKFQEDFLLVVLLFMVISLVDDWDVYVVDNVITVSVDSVLVFLPRYTYLVKDSIPVNLSSTVLSKKEDVYHSKCDSKRCRTSGKCRPLYIDR